LPVGATIKINRELIEALLPLKGKTVYILPDNDSAGWEYAKTINQALNTLEIKSQIIPTPRLWDKSDIADFIEVQTLKGKTKEEIREEILSWCKPKEKEKIVSFWEAMQIEKERGLDRFIVPGLFPEKGLGLLVGRSKLGKTELLCLIVAKLLRGEPLFNRPSEKVKVLWITQEDTKISLGTRLMTRGITIEELKENLFTEVIEEETTIPKDILIEEAKRLGCQMVIVEPLLAIKELAELGIKDKLTYGAVYSVLLPLKKKAEETGIFVLGVHHTTKGKAVFKDWVDVIDGTLGSSAFAGVPDCIIGIGLTLSGEHLRRVLAKGRGVMLDYLIEWVWEEVEIQGKKTLFGKYIEKEEYSPEFDLTPEQRRLVEAIKELGENATPKRIAQELGKTEGAVKMMLGELLDKGVVVKTKRGVYSISKKQKEPYFAYFTNFTYFSYFPYFAYFDTESKEKSDRLSYFQSLENSGLEAKVRKVSKVSLVENPTPSNDPPTSLSQKIWRIRVKNTFCKCGCNEWKIKVNPYEHKESLIFAECLNCNFERLIDLIDFEILEEPQNDDIPF
jgi:replicative DNA helicase